MQYARHRQCELHIFDFDLGAAIGKTRPVGGVTNQCRKNDRGEDNTGKAQTNPIVIAGLDPAIHDESQHIMSFSIPFIRHAEAIARETRQHGLPGQARQ